MSCNRDDFAHFAKSSKAIKSLVEKEVKGGSRPGSRGGSRPGTPVRSRKNVNIDKALTAFKVTRIVHVCIHYLNQDNN